MYTRDVPEHDQPCVRQGVLAHSLRELRGLIAAEDAETAQSLDASGRAARVPQPHAINDGVEKLAEGIAPKVGQRGRPEHDVELCVDRRRRDVPAVVVAVRLDVELVRPVPAEVDSRQERPCCRGRIVLNDESDNAVSCISTYSRVQQQCCSMSHRARIPPRVVRMRVEVPWPMLRTPRRLHMLPARSLRRRGYGRGGRATRLREGI